MPQQLERLGRELGQHRVVVILDQNLPYPQGKVLGTDLCRRLRSEHAWDGLIFVQVIAMCSKNRIY